MPDMESMGNEKAADNRLEALREDLRVDVKKLTPVRGDVLIVSPRNPQYILSQQYTEFLYEGLSTVANGASVVIATDQISKMNNLKPPERDVLHAHYQPEPDINLDKKTPAVVQGYLDGWQAAMETVAKVLGNAV